MSDDIRGDSDEHPYTQCASPLEESEADIVLDIAGSLYRHWFWPSEPPVPWDEVSDPLDRRPFLRAARLAVSTMRAMLHTADDAACVRKAV